MTNKLHRLALLAALAVVLSAAPAHARAQADGPLAAELARLARAAEQRGAELGAAVVEIEGDRLRVSHQSDRPLNPASNMKIVTAWAALRLLGPEHRFLTGLYGRIEGARIGELVIRSDGDPSLEPRHLWEMLAELRRAGLREVGDIVVDQSRFDAAFVPPAFAQQPGEWAAFRAPVAAVSLAANTIALEVHPTAPGSAARVTVFPESFVDLGGSVQTSAAGRPDALRLSLSPAAGRLAIELGGSVPAGPHPVRVWKRVDDPTLLAGYALRDLCLQMGIAVRGKVRAGGKGVQARLAARRSEPLARLLWALGKHSNNFGAEMIFKSLSGRGREAASFARSAELVRGELAAAGIDPAPLRIENGSGLFDANRLSAAALARLLASSYRDPRLGAELVAQLAIGGVDGTLRHRFAELAKGRRLRAKSGTLADVSSLSGYLLGEEGRPALAFSVMVNGARGKTVALRDDIDRFVGALAALR